MSLKMSLCSFYLLLIVFLCVFLCNRLHVKFLSGTQLVFSSSRWQHGCFTPLELPESFLLYQGTYTDCLSHLKLPLIESSESLF